MSALQAQATGAAPRPFLSVPRPPGLPVLGNALQIKTESFHQRLEAWEKQYGKTFAFRIGARQFLVVSDPDVIASVLRQRPGTFHRGPRLEQVAKEVGFHGLFSSNGETWKRQRPMVLAGLDPSHTRTFLPAIADVTARLKARWVIAANSGASIDLLADLMRYTVDVTTCLAFGKNLNTLEQGDGTAIQQHLNVIFPALMKRLLAPVDFRRWIKDKSIQAHVQALRVEVAAFIGEARKQLADEPALREKPRNLIQALIAAKDRGDGGITDAELSGNVLTMLLAGEDTTANTLAWMTWLLFTNPQALARAREEVDRLMPKASIVDTVEQLSALEEVEACAHEAMRLRPVAPFNILHAGEDVVVAGVMVPKGAFVVCLMRPASLEESNFPQPTAYDPGRWRSPEDGSVKAMSSAKRVSMPFGAGPRMCPGRYLAIAEIKMVAAMLLSNFEIEDVSAPGRAAPAEKLSLTMAPVGLRMKLRLCQRSGQGSVTA
jgi:cytochrome P450